MTDWAIRKIVVIAEDKNNPMHTTTLELDRGHLNQYLGMFWASPGSAATLDHFYQAGFPNHGPSTLADVLGNARALGSANALKSAGASAASDVPAVYLKDPECTLYEFP